MTAVEIVEVKQSTSTKIGVRLGFNAYRRHVIWGFLWIACPESMQPEDVIVTQAERFAKAAVDLDTFGALVGVQ